MPTWSGILDELNEEQRKTKRKAFDNVRRKYLSTLSEYTRRETILYASKWTQHDVNVSLDLISITDEDLQGAMEVIHGLGGPKLDLILHSPGGSVDAAEALVRYLRSKFEHVRVIVPSLAMSAAAMMACAADVLLLGKHSFLGPIDPQLMLSTPLGLRMVPAQAILEQFDRACEECKDSSKLGPWLPMLAQYGPGLLVECRHASDLSQKLVQAWLETYMFKNDPTRSSKAEAISQWLSDHQHFKTHGRHISREELEDNGLKVERLEDDEKLQDLVLSVFHATTHTFTNTPAVKIIENHLGKAFIKLQALVPMPSLPEIPGSPPPAPTDE